MSSGFGITITAPLDANSNVEVNLPLTDTQSGFAAMTSCNDSGAVSLARSMKDAYSSDDYRLQVGRSAVLMDWNFNGTAQATGQWSCSFTTMTMTEGGGSVLLNASSTAGAASGCALQSWRYFKLMGGAELYGVQTCLIATGALESGQVMEFGFFVKTATTAPADGAYFRLTSAGTLCVVNYNGVETVVALPNGNFGSGSGGMLVPGQAYFCGINVNSYLTEFWINNVLVATIATPTGQGTPYASVALPWAFQQRNVGAITGAQAQLKVMLVHVEQDDLDLNLPYGQALGAAGQCGIQGQEGGSAGSTAIYPGNTVAPTTGVVNNTTALVTGLGGIFAITVTAAANVDGIATDYTVPVGGVAQVPRTYMITGVQVHGVVITALTGGPMANIWSLAVGHTATSLATAESASFATGTAKAPRRYAIGVEGYTSGALIGATGSQEPLTLDLSQSGVAVNPGEHIALIVRNAGTAPTGGAVAYATTVKGYWI